MKIYDCVRQRVYKAYIDPQENNLHTAHVVVESMRRSG